MSEHCSHELLSLRIDDVLPPEEAAQVDSHLSVCDSCRQQMAELQAVVEGLGEQARLQPPAQLGPRIVAALQAPQPWYRAALSTRWLMPALGVTAALLVCVVGGVRLLGPPSPPPTQVAMRVLQAQAGGQQRFVARGERLRSGDRLAVEVELARPAYVYVLQNTPSGQAEVVAATPQDQPAPSQATLRLPSGERWLQLDSQRGIEHLFVVASLAPLTPTELAQRTHSDSAPPLEAASATRGGGTGPLRARLDAGGAATLDFWFRHD